MFEVIGNVADVLALVGAIVSAVFAAKAFVEARKGREEALAERKRLTEKVTFRLRLTADGTMKTLPVTCERSQLTRAEMQGRLGNARRNMKVQYQLAALADQGVLDQIDAVRNGTTTEIVIPATQEEMEQFHFAL